MNCTESIASVMTGVNIKNRFGRKCRLVGINMRFLVKNDADYGTKKGMVFTKNTIPFRLQDSLKNVEIKQKDTGRSRSLNKEDLSSFYALKVVRLSFIYVSRTYCRRRRLMGICLSVVVTSSWLSIRLMYW